MTRLPGILLGLVVLATGCREPRGATEARAEDGLRDVDAPDAADLISRGEVVVLDLRTPGEFEAGHIANAVNIDATAADFESRLAGLDRDRAYLIHCRSGRRSRQALLVFERLGFRRVAHLDGGTLAWVAAGNPLKK